MIAYVSKNKKYAAIFNHSPMVDQIFMYHYVIVQQVVKTSCKRKQIVGPCKYIFRRRPNIRSYFTFGNYREASNSYPKKVIWWSLRQKNNCMSIFVSVL